MSKQYRILVAYPHVPYVTGGIELAAEALVRTFREMGHRAEPLTMPFLLPTPDGLTRACMMWRMLDVSRSYFNDEIDMVVPLKFPAYGLRHPNKVCWIMHQFREAYELSRVTHHVTPDKRGEDLYRYIFEFDQLTLGECRKIFTGSETISKRMSHFNDLESEPIYCPSPYVRNLKAGEAGDYVLQTGRLEEIKRPKLLVEAMALTKTPVKAKITGTGQEREHLERLIEARNLGDKVELCGFVTEEDLSELYANCLGVVYIPFNEDYGLGVIEGFHAEKPVITCKDSGGPTDLIEKDVTGLVVDSTPEDLAAHIDRLYTERERAAELGKAGKCFVDTLSWEKLADRLLEFVG